MDPKRIAPVLESLLFDNVSYGPTGGGKIATLGHAMKKLFVLSILFASLSSGHGAPFQNLDFEAAITNSVRFNSPSPPFVYGQGSVTDLLPGWNLTTYPYNGMNFNQGAIGSDSIAIPAIWQTDVFNQFPYVITKLSPVTYGNYVFYLQQGPRTDPFFLSQVGDVPVNARLLQLDVVRLITFSLGYVRTFLNGTEIINGDISAFTGKHNVTLEMEIGRTSNLEAPDIIIDNITFVVSDPVLVENDFNADGLSDIIFEHQDGFFGAWFMNKGPDLFSASFLNPQAVVDPRWHIVGTGNFTETNKTDLLFQHEDRSLAVWSMDGTNLVSAALLNPSQPGEGWQVVGTGDMKRDGKKDILFQHTDGTLAVWLMDGINLVSGALLNPNKPGGSGWRVVGTAALSSVGNTDLIFQHSDGTLAAWYMDGTNLVRGALLNPAVPGQEGWRVAATLDLNGDGQTDLLFQHDDGTLAVWLMDGINLSVGNLLNPENPGAGWRIAGPR